MGKAVGEHEIVWPLHRGEFLPPIDQGLEDAVLKRPTGYVLFCREPKMDNVAFGEIVRPSITVGDSK